MIEEKNDLSSIEDLPLVTFAIFAYNQEKYIREAVEGAFAQIYEPLEIILSDDCSTDRTFEIMKELACAYRGKHQIVLNKTADNIGTIDHVVTVARMSHGQLIIVAAGDDVSDANRSVETVHRWLGTGASVVQSNYREMNDKGEHIISGLGQRGSLTIQKWFHGCNTLLPFNGFYPTIIGCTAAYERNFLSAIPLNNRKCLNEDALTTILCILNERRIETIEVDLVSHRRHQGNVSSDQHAKKMRDLKRNELSKVRFAQSTSNFIDFIYTFLKREVESGKPAHWLQVAENIMAERKLMKLYANVWKISFFDRLFALITSKNRDEFLLLLPRMFGLDFFIFLRKFFGRT